MTISLFIMLTAMMAQKYADDSEIAVVALWTLALIAAVTGH